MKLETFFEKFELFADAPDAVAKIRELVLEMALRGKLSEQLVEDASDPEWLTLVRRLDAGAEAATALADAPYEIPSVWRWTTLHGLGETKPRNEAPDSAQASFVPMTLIPAAFGQTAQHEVRPWSEIKKGYTHFIDGDVVMAKITPCFENGKSAVMGGLTGGIGAGTTELHVFRRSTAAVLPEFVIIQLKSHGYITRGIPRMTGSAGQRRVPYDYFAKAPFPLPPIAEQKRIVAKVDELMALCDRLEAQQHERETRHAALARASLARFTDAPTPANLDLLFHKSYSISPADLRKSILTLAVQGKLVPQDPNDEPAEHLLMRVAKKRTALLQAGHPNRDESSTQLRKQQAQALPQNLGPLAPGWAWATLMQASLFVVDCHNKTAPYVESGIRLLRTTNIRDGRLNDLEAKYVDDATYERWSARCKPAPGDILITREAPMGETCIIPDGMKVCLGQRMMLIRIVPGTMETKYLLYSLMAPDLMDRVQDKPVGATVQHLRVGGVETLLTPVPPLAEQRRIVAKVDELMALVDALENQLATTRTAGAALLEAAIHELLNPTAEIIPFPSSERESLPDRAAIGCYAIQRLADQRTFGRTAEVKVLYLAEAHLGLDLGGRYLRDAAGPLDQWIYKFEEDAARLRWFSVVESQTKDGHKKIEYRAGPELSAKAQETSTRLSAAQRREFDRLLGLLAQKPTVEVEAIATLFAAWNDFLLDGQQPSDDEIVREVRENWHPSKQRFKEPELKTWLEWLRQHALVPQGRGPHTAGQQGRLQLH
jgi:type I restriction enzyme S subunit